MILTTVCAALLCLLAASFGDAESDELQNFAFVIGEWEGVFHLHPSSIQPNPVETPAVMASRWGPNHSWIETDSTMELPSLGMYAVKVIVRFDISRNMYDSFVVNTFGNGARYSGVRDGNKLVFTGEVGKITQRVTYELLSENEMSFRVEHSQDGNHFVPHSDIMWHRKK